MMFAAVAAALLAACGSNDNPAIENIAPPAENSVEDNALQPVDDASANRPARGPDSALDEAMQWQFATTEAGPRLTYGEPKTDNVRLSLRCEQGDTVLAFIRPRKIVADRPDRLTLTSGGKTSDVAIEARETALGGMNVEAKVPTGSEPLRAFAAGNPLEIRWGGETIKIPVADQSNRYFDNCSG